MRTVKHLLDAKGHHVWTISPDASVFDAIEMMANKEVGALMVTHGDKPIGIVSERDYARKVILQGRSSQETAIKEIMTTALICAHLDQTVEECMAVMTEKRIRHLPVIEDGRLVGMISIGDLVKAIIADQQFVIDQLAHYISG